MYFNSFKAIEEINKANWNTICRLYRKDDIRYEDRVREMLALADSKSINLTRW